MTRLMKTVQIEDLSGPALSWAVATVLHGPDNVVCVYGVGVFITVKNDTGGDTLRLRSADYVNDWRLTGTLIDEYKLGVGRIPDGMWIAASPNLNSHQATGGTPQTALCRALLYHFGGRSSIDVPKHLLEERA